MERVGGLALSLLVCLVWQAPALGQDGDAVKKELGKLQGEWTMVSGVADGYAMPDQMLSASKRVCKGDEVSTTIGGQVVMKAKITIDPTKSPKTIDYQVTDGPTKGKKHLGIYEIDGDTFKSCFGAPGAERPGDFASRQGDRQTFSVWRRHDSKALGHVVLTPDQLKWGPAPAGLPPGSQMAVLDGDPGKEGLFTLRAKLPAGYKVPPHWHSTDEHITVLSGTLLIGDGETLDKTAATKLPAGGYMAMPAKMHHFAFCDEETIIQVHAMGPFDITYIHPGDDPRRIQKE